MHVLYLKKILTRREKARPWNINHKYGKCQAIHVDVIVRQLIWILKREEKNEQVDMTSTATHKHSGDVPDISVWLFSSAWEIVKFAK